MEEFRRQLASTRSEVNEKRLAAEGAQRCAPAHCRQKLPDPPSLYAVHRTLSISTAALQPSNSLQFRGPLSARWA